MRFRGRTLIEGPGVREAWHRGRRDYYVLVLRIGGGDDPAAEVLARRAAVWGALAPWLLPASPEDPHVTAWVYGFGRPPPHPAEGARVRVRIGGADSFASCAFLKASVAGAEGIRRGAEAVAAGPEERWAPWVPHLTVGRYGAEVGAREVAARLRGLRWLPGLEAEARLVTCALDPADPSGGLWDLYPEAGCTSTTSRC